jgi:hypothetical protein
MAPIQIPYGIWQAFQLAMATLVAAKMGYFDGQKYWDPKGWFRYRIGTVGIESSMFDLFQCAVNNKEKRDKRIRRFLMIKDLYTQVGYEFGPEIDQMVKELNKLQIEDGTETSDAEMMAKLMSEINEKEESRDGKLYFETGEWRPPVTKQFHGFCTKAINKDGDVYDLMTRIAVISYATLMSSATDLTECEKELLAGSQLIFKGGAAIGKFLFKNKPFWNRLSEDAQREIEESFILGGDNDTSLYFANMKNVVKNHGEKIASDSVISIADKLQKIVWDTCYEFDVSKLLQDHSNTVMEKQFSFGGSEFSFEKRSAKGFRLSEVDAYERDDFEIVDADIDDFEVVAKPTVLCLSPYTDREKSQVFTTQSTVQFDTQGKTVKFELVRAKLGFVGKHGDASVNSYSELLDISLDHPTSEALFKKVWARVDL